MDMRTPLGKVRGLGSAKEGTEHFWHQRLTAVANVPLMLFFVILVISMSSMDFVTARETMAHPVIAILTSLMVISGVIHMKLGMQIVIEDYIHTEGLKVLSLLANTFFSVLIGFSALYAIAKISFGG
ncbi:succinate dehydrogenase, hydrophobic membrane anchor protein [Coralliovum pocilloporae]|uniref:succinate dehydrogenase, hydrophobic membrane anchor protein n=1 Tax=Coralliovum pocilloporae TaxID=3066369 RepID=UPI003306FA27